MDVNQFSARPRIGGGWKNWLTELERTAMPLRRILAKAIAPDPSRLGHPRFSDRIKDRKQRWLIDKQPNPYTAVSSKLGGTAFMRSLGHAVPEVYGTYPSLNDIPRFEDLPRAFVLKPTRGWAGAGVFLMRDGFDLKRKRHLTRAELIQTAQSYTGFGVQGIAGPWVAEELLFNFDDPDKAALDYKFFCFGPKVAAIQINQRSGLKDPEYLVWLRDCDWQPLSCQLRWQQQPERSALTKPPFLNEMLKMASDAGGRLNIFLRIDLFASHRGPVFCEFTAYPHSGIGYTPRADAWLGSLWKTRDGGVDDPTPTPGAP
jgi:hypothetical protein